jgi:nitrite reductase/ring-hydroxylating ferredoxin subunit
MAFPDSIKVIGEQVEAGRDIAPPPELFDAYDVFAAELAQIFTRPWLAVDHASRLAADGDYVRADVGARSVVLVRESEDQIHALRNACLHAGYRVCEADSGNAEQLYCQYHGWFYALDGRLTDPLLRPKITDRSRFRLPRYAMRIERGLLLVDLSQVAPNPPPAGPVELGVIPEDLGERTVSRRQRYQTTGNWKKLRQFLWASPGLAFAAEGGCDEVVELGPLSFVALKDGDAALVRLNPRFPGQCEIDLVAMPKAGPKAGSSLPPADSAAAADPLGEALREQAASIAAAPLVDRAFYEWYWPLLAPAAAAAAAAATA